MPSGILVICERHDGGFKKTAYELLGKANALVAQLGGTVSAVVIGSTDAGDLGQFGVGTVYAASGSGLDGENTGGNTRAIAAAIEAADPIAVLAPASPRYREALPRLAARLGLGMATECTDLTVQDGALVGRRPMYAGKAFADVRMTRSPGLFTVRPNSFSAPTAGTGTANVSALSVTCTGDDLAVRVVGTEEPRSASVDLSEADRIVSGGRPLGSTEKFDSVIRPLAAAFGATTGASRAAVDAGYASHTEQVGQTGKVVNPSLYVACAISGAIQHLAGMRTSRIIVAINKDPDAPIFKHATYGIVGDVFEICPLLVEEAKAALS
jgi:electron transfer flavoprotein alpha subunit